MPRDRERDDRDAIPDLPDARDGLTRLERVTLWQLRELERELAGRDPGRTVPTAMLYGRVVEHVDVSVEAFQAVLQRLLKR